jgi:hypothetical protein
MKRVVSLSVLVLFVAVPVVAQTSAQGSFNYKGTEGLQVIEFDAVGDERSAQGYFTLVGPTLVSDGELAQEDPKQTILVRDFGMKVEVDCMSATGTRVTMGGIVRDSNVRSMIGRVATLTVEDNDLNTKDPTDRFTFGSYWEKDITWFPTDEEVKGDAGWAMSWWATDAERKDDVGYMISRTRQVNCRSFPVATYDLAAIGEGRITVINRR